MNLWLQNDCDLWDSQSCRGLASWSDAGLSVGAELFNSGEEVAMWELSHIATFSPELTVDKTGSWLWMSPWTCENDMPLLIFTSETDNELPKASTQRPIHLYLVSNFTCAEAVASRRTVRFSGSHSHCGISSALCARTTLFEIFYMGRWSRLLGTRCVLMHFLCLTGALLVFVPGLRQYFCDVSRSGKTP